MTRLSASWQLCGRCLALLATLAYSLQQVRRGPPAAVDSGAAVPTAPRVILEQGMQRPPF